jgi:hypothetical protein
MDFPGQYMRRIKTLSVSVPCVAGPYTGVNATLTMLNHSYRVQPTDASSYADKSGNGADGLDARFSTTRVPISSIAVSSGQNDAGVFELSLTSERYLPFEGAGAISTWKMELPQIIRAFDYGSIADVLLHVKYTSLDGGGFLKEAASNYVSDFIQGKASRPLSEQQGFQAMFDLRADFSSAWAQAAGALPPGGAVKRELILGRLTDRLPYYTRGRDPIARKFTLIQETENPFQEVSLEHGDGAREVTLGAPLPLTSDGTRMFTNESNKEEKFGEDQWKLVLSAKAEDDGQRPTFGKMYLVVRFTLAPPKP